jgi:hypothetical protein
MDKGKILLIDTPAGFQSSTVELVRAYLETLEIGPEATKANN